jgi:hypothetical protein
MSCYIPPIYNLGKVFMLGESGEEANRKKGQFNSRVGLITRLYNRGQQRFRLRVLQAAVGRYGSATFFEIQTPVLGGASVLVAVAAAKPMCVPAALTGPPGLGRRSAPGPCGTRSPMSMSVSNFRGSISTRRFPAVWQRSANPARAPGHSTVSSIRTYSASCSGSSAASCIDQIRVGAGLKPAPTAS